MLQGLWRWLIDWRSHLRTLTWLVLISTAVNIWQSRQVPKGPAPAMDALLVSALGEHGESLQTWLARHRGQVVVVHFWASWCPVCQASQGNVARLQGGSPIVTVAMQSGDARAVQKHLQQNALPWLAAIDAQGQIAQAWGVQAVPATLILDREGRVASTSMGYSTTLGLWARLMWVRWL